MVMPLRCDLGHMRHAQHLRAATEMAQCLADDFCGGAADTAVGFIQYQRRNACPFGCNGLDGKADARQFAAGCDPCQRSRWQLRIRRYLKLHTFQSVARLLRQELDDELRGRHAQTMQLCFYVAAEHIARVAAHRAQCRCEREELLARCGHFRFAAWPFIARVL